MVDGRHSGLLCEVVALEPQEEGRSGKRLGHFCGTFSCVLPAVRGGGSGTNRGGAFSWAAPGLPAAAPCAACCALPQITNPDPPTNLTLLHLPADRARVRLLPSYESVTVRCKELGEKEERTREEREKERERERGGSRGGDRSGRSGRSSRGEDGGREERQRHKRGGWAGLGAVWRALCRVHFAGLSVQSAAICLAVHLAYQGGSSVLLPRLSCGAPSPSLNRPCRWPTIRPG